MKYLLRSMVITILILFISGCASVFFSEKERLATGGKYSELERILETENKDISYAKSDDLIELCNTYSKLKRYNKLFSCVEQLEINIKRGDKIIKHHSLVSFSYPQNITVIPYLLKAEAYIELGDYDKAVASAKKAYGLLPTIEWSLKDNYYSWELHCRVRSLSILALAYALKGDSKNASQYVDQLENEEISMHVFMKVAAAGVTIKKEKSLGLARAYMALGKYDKIMNDKGGFIDAYGEFMEGTVGVSYAFLNLPQEFAKNKALYETGHTVSFPVK